MVFKRVRKIEKVLLAEIEKLSESELKKLIGECQNLTTTNCSWIEYGLKSIVTEVAKTQLRWRKIEERNAAPSG